MRRSRGFDVIALVLAGSLPAGATTPWTATPAPPSRVLLFEARIQADAPVLGCHAAESPFQMGFSMARDLIAQGEGIVSGPPFGGRMTWSQVARRFPANGYCRTLVAGFLETADGAEVFFEASGYGVEANPDEPGAFQFGMALRFEDPDAPHEWLANTIFTLEGELSTTTRRGRYRVFRRASSPSNNVTSRKGQDE